MAENPIPGPQATATLPKIKLLQPGQRYVSPDDAVIAPGNFVSMRGPIVLKNYGPTLSFMIFDAWPKLLRRYRDEHGFERTESFAGPALDVHHPAVNRLAVNAHHPSVEFGPEFLIGWDRPNATLFAGTQRDRDVLMRLKEMGFVTLTSHIATENGKCVAFVPHILTWLPQPSIVRT